MNCERSSERFASILFSEGAAVYETPTPDWNEGHATLREYANDYYRGPRDWLSGPSLLLPLLLWWFFGLFNYWTLGSMAWAGWILHRLFMAAGAHRVLAEGYQMGHEAGFLAARGVSMKQYKDYLAQDAEAERNVFRPKDER
jgi:hypothetical protein